MLIHLGLLLGCLVSQAGPAGDLSQSLAQPVVPARQTLAEVQDSIEARLPPPPTAATADEWIAKARKYREDTFAKVIFRGEAARWREVPTRAEWLGQIEGGPGYTIRKLRFEVIPGFWIPALLYEPSVLSGKVPVVLNVNGHDANGKAADYKQIRCINLAKKGILALNLEWLGMGQLGGKANDHGLINGIDLCGTSGIALHYLSMSRGLDILLGLEHADPARVGVTGLSGGGWQTIYISSLDERVSLSNPVAGYSSFRTRIRHFSDLGDSEQTASELATVVDYDHLTAMRAPRPTLLTYNAKDNCCFAAPHALPPLLAAAGPIFRLFDRPGNLRSHINTDPGTHNYELDNRTAFYQMVSDQWSNTAQVFNPQEIPSKTEVKTPEQLAVELPADNLSIAKVAQKLAEKEPRYSRDSPEARAASDISAERLARLRSLVKPVVGELRAEPIKESSVGETKVAAWKLKVGDSWSVPVVEFSRGEPKSTTILIADEGRSSLAKRVEALLETGQRVLAVDLYGFGESTLPSHGYLFALTLGAVGERPLGVTSGELIAVAQWVAKRDGRASTVEASGPRTSSIALVASALDDKAIAALVLRRPLGSLKELIETQQPYSTHPELFAFGLLEWFDLKTIAGLVAPRTIRLEEASERAVRELTPR